jgi:Tol biopolymer transport system component
VVALGAPTPAQDGFNLPTELYVLLNDGVLERYGLGAQGVQHLTPEGAFVLDFAVSSDNGWLAYRTLESLSIASLHESSPARSLNDKPSYPDIRGKGDTLAWSPQGDALAYTGANNGYVTFLLPDDTPLTLGLNVAGLQDVRWSPQGGYLAMGAVDNVWWIFAREGTPSAPTMRLTSAISDGTSLIWLSDSVLAFTPAGGGMVAMDVADANRQFALLPADVAYHLPFAISPTSFWAFRGTPTSATLYQVAYEGQTFVARQVGTNAIDLTGARWSPDGSLLVIFQAGVLAFALPQSGEGFTLPIASASAYGWGALYPPLTNGYPLAGRAILLATLPQGSVAQAWRIAEDGALAQALTDDDSATTALKLSNDGTRLAYVQGGALFYTRLDGVDDTRYRLLEGLTGALSLAFSADASALFIADGTSVRRADLASGQVFPFVAGAYGALLPARRLNALSAVLDGETHIFDPIAGETFGSFPYAPSWWLNGAQVVAVADNALVRINVNTLAEAPATLARLPQGATVRDVLQIDADTVRLLYTQGLLAQVVVADVPLAGGDLREVARAGGIYAPRLSPDGTQVLGLARPQGGDVVLFDVANARIVRLNLGLRAQALAWE